MDFFNLLFSYIYIYMLKHRLSFPWIQCVHRKPKWLERSDIPDKTFLFYHSKKFFLTFVFPAVLIFSEKVIKITRDVKCRKNNRLLKTERFLWSGFERFFRVVFYKNQMGHIHLPIVFNYRINLLHSQTQRQFLRCMVGITDDCVAFRYVQFGKCKIHAGACAFKGIAVMPVCFMKNIPQLRYCFLVIVLQGNAAKPDTCFCFF